MGISGRETGEKRKHCAGKEKSHKNNIYTHIYIYMHIYIYTHTHIYIYIYIHTHIHTYIHTYIHTCIHAYMHTCIHAYMHTYIHTYIHTYMYICMYVYIYIYIHTYTHIHAQMQVQTHTTGHVAVGRMPYDNRSFSNSLPGALTHWVSPKNSRRYRIPMAPLKDSLQNPVVSTQNSTEPIMNSKEPRAPIKPLLERIPKP